MKFNFTLKTGELNQRKSGE